MAAVTLGLGGCSANSRYPLIPIDQTPKQLDKSDSFALQVLKSSWEKIPFNIKDGEVPNAASYNSLSYATMGSLGLLSNGLFGGMSSLGLTFFMNTNTHPGVDRIHYVAWVPADDIDIKDLGAIRNYIHKHYFTPALEEFVNSDFNKNMKHPTTIVDDSTFETKITGDSCNPIVQWLGGDKFDYDSTCQLFWSGNVFPQNYATVESGIPFTPEVKAVRYIVVRITDINYLSVGVLAHLKSNMIHAYVPIGGYRALSEHLGRFAPKDEPIFHKTIPFVMSKNKTFNFFLKQK